MSSSQHQPSVVELQARWIKIRSANVYDTLDSMGYSNQCLDLGIRPLFPRQRIAGQAVTAKGGRNPLTRKEAERDNITVDYFGAVMAACYPGCVVVIETGGEPHSGKFGEMTSWAIKQRGARGIVLDSFIRDWLGLEVIPDYSVFARGTSPIESADRWRILSVNEPIAMPGTLTSQVRINPGDWIVGDPDGVIVVPQEIAMETLIKAEDVERREQGMREDAAAGMSFEDAYAKWGRA